MFLVDDDLGQKIGKMRYHYFQNRHFSTLDGIFEINLISLTCLGVFRKTILLTKGRTHFFSVRKYRSPFINKK